MKDIQGIIKKSKGIKVKNNYGYLLELTRDHDLMITQFTGGFKDYKVYIQKESLGALIEVLIELSKEEKEYLDALNKEVKIWSCTKNYHF